MAKFNHMFVVAFTVVSEKEDGSDVTPSMMRSGLERRMRDLDDNNEWEEAVGAPEDTYEEDE